MPVAHIKFAAPLVNAIPALFAITPADWDALYQTAKDTPTKLLRGHSPRSAMIWLSEAVMKPRFGDDVFGHLAVNQINNTPANTVIVSDCGFNAEMRALKDAFGASNLLLIHILRPGSNFTGDSREWIIDDNVETLAINNSNTLETLESRVYECVERWLSL